MCSARLSLLASCFGILAAGCVVGSESTETAGSLDVPPELPRDFPGPYGTADEGTDWKAESLTTTTPRARVAFTRSGNTVTFQNLSVGKYDSMEWWIGRECLYYDLDYVDWVVHRTGRTGFSANLPRTALVPEPGWNQTCAITYYWISAYLVSNGAPIPGSGTWRQIQ